MKKDSTNIDTTKVLSYLLEVHSKTKEPTTLSLSTITRKHRVGLSATKVLVEGGIIAKERTGRGNKQFKYSWLSIHPNINMAEKVCVEISKHTQVANQKSRGGVVKQVETPKLLVAEEVKPEPTKVKRTYTKRAKVETEQPVAEKTRSFSFAWGLISFNY